MYRNLGSHNKPFRGVGLVAGSGSRRSLGADRISDGGGAVSVLPLRLRE